MAFKKKVCQNRSPGWFTAPPQSPLWHWTRASRKNRGGSKVIGGEAGEPACLCSWIFLWSQSGSKLRDYQSVSDIDQQGAPQASAENGEKRQLCAAAQDRSDGLGRLDFCLVTVPWGENDVAES